MLDSYTTRTASDAPKLPKAFFLVLFSGGPTEEPAALCWRFRGSGHWLISSAETFLQLRGMKINLHPMTIVTVCFVLYVLFSVSKCPKVSDAHLKLI